MNLCISTLVYAGLAAILAGAVSVVKPLEFLRIRTRARGALILLISLVAAVATLVLPAGDTRIQSQIDEFAPVYQMGEIRTIRVNAPHDRIYAAIREVTLDEIAFFQTLTWMRRFGRRGRESLIDASGGRLLLETATRTGFFVLAEDPGSELVLGAASSGKGTARITPA